MTSLTKNYISLILGIIAIGIAILNIGLLIAFAILYWIIVESTLLFFSLGIGASVLGIFLLWKLVESSVKQRTLIGVSLIMGISFFGVLLLFLRANIDFSRLDRLSSLQLVLLTDLAIYSISTLLTLLVGVLLLSGLKFVKKQYSNAKVKKSLLGVFMIIVLAIPIFGIPFLTTHYPLYPPGHHGDLEPGISQSTDLFVSGTEGYYSYRIPSLLILPNATILAFAEGRKYSAFDMGNIDVVLKRSEDGGQTWSSLIVLVDAGLQKAGEPCPVYDDDTGIVWFAYCLEASQVFLINSSDAGKTWSSPWNITLYVKPNSWPDWFVTGPGHGIQLKIGAYAGRLLIPTYVRIPNSTVTHSLMIYSDDHGLSWQRGNYTTVGSENEVVEAVNGSIYMTIRPQYSSSQRRLYSWSHDGGLNWGPVEIETNLRDPTCQASITRLTDLNTSAKNRIIISNPSHLTDRSNMTIHLSYNETNTWDVSKVLYTGNAGYSDIGVLSNDTICILFEIGDKNMEKPGFHDYHDYLIFVKFDLSWLET